MKNPTVHTVTRDLAYLQEAWPAIVNLKIPGTARTWVETPRRRGVLSPADRERLGKKGVPRQAPVDVGVHDLLANIASRSEDIGRCIVDVAGLGAAALSADQARCMPWAWSDVDAEIVAAEWYTAQFLPARSGLADPRPWLIVARTWLAAADEFDDRTVPWVDAQIAGPVAAAARLLGDVRDGQVMNGICPWCEGRTIGALLGGERTMQIVYPDVDDENDEPVIVCTGEYCAPPASACGMHRDGMPAWPRREWDWLSTMLHTPGAQPTHEPSAHDFAATK